MMLPSCFFFEIFSLSKGTHRGVVISQLFIRLLPGGGVCVCVCVRVHVCVQRVCVCVCVRVF